MGKIEEFRYTQDLEFHHLQIEGVTTCEAGNLILRAYRGSGDNKSLVGVSKTYIEGFVFEALIQNVPYPIEDLSLEYVIKT